MNHSLGKNPPTVLSETDRQILIALQKDANPSIKQLADKLNLSKTQYIIG